MGCLILERHAWETGGRESQVQIPLRVANNFFGNGNYPIQIIVLYEVLPGHPISINCSVSEQYRNGTRRINGLSLIGNLGHCFLFFQETENQGEYEFWWQSDMALIAAKYNNWIQGRNSQHGRGRLAKIIPNHVDKNITHI